MSFDLTNKNISDTFQNLLQKTGSDGKLYDLVGNEVTDLRIAGNLIAESYIVSSSIISQSISAYSGSTTFGDSPDDTHTFEGDISASGGVTVGAITASYIYLTHDIDGTDRSAHPGNLYMDGNNTIKTDDSLHIYGTLNVDNNTFVVNNVENKVGIGKIPSATSKELTVHGDISASGGISSSNITTTGYISSSGTIYGQSAVFDETGLTIAGSRIEYTYGNIKLRDNGLATNGHITASGNISSSGTVYAENLILSGGLGVFTSASLAEGGSGGGGISFDGSSTNGVLTYKDSDEATVESNLIFDGNNLSLNGLAKITGSLEISGSESFMIKLRPSGSKDFIRCYSQYGQRSLEVLQGTTGAGYWDLYSSHSAGVSPKKVHHFTDPNVDSGVGGYLNYIGGGNPTYFGIGNQDWENKPPGKALQVYGDISASGDFYFGNTSGAYISGSDGNIEISGSGFSQLEVDHRYFDTGSTTLSSAGGAIGDTIKFGDASGLDEGQCYYLDTDGTWEKTDSDFGGKTSGSIAIATSGNATEGMVLRGVVKLDHDPGGNPGAPLYLSTTAGQLTFTRPGSGDFVRVVGYNLDASGLIFFNPGDTTLKVA